MSKKHNKQPTCYQGLVQSNEAAKTCVVIDKNEQVFKFTDPSKIHIIKDAIAHNFLNWEEHFDKQPKEAILDWHKKIFKCDPPANQDLTQTSLWCYMALVKNALDRTDKAAEEAANKDKKLANRTYTYHKEGDAASIKTPQAKVCLQILIDAIDTKTSQVTEIEFKKHIDRRAAEIRTRQDPWRIFQYYRPLLMKAKLLTHN